MLMTRLPALVCLATLLCALTPATSRAVAPPVHPTTPAPGSGSGVVLPPATGDPALDAANHLGALAWAPVALQLSADEENNIKALEGHVILDTGSHKIKVAGVTVGSWYMNAHVAHVAATVDLSQPPGFENIGPT